MPTKESEETWAVDYLDQGLEDFACGENEHQDSMRTDCEETCNDPSSKVCFRIRYFFYCYYN
uniref:CRP1 n=1 Tax=Microplitis bicoloratus bracovirus TaxID=359323 RepID=Q2V8D3_9VIRU|nr:CRP1 [Microplitis bicoloratus bracovirus]